MVSDGQRKQFVRELRMLRGGRGLVAGRTASCQQLCAHLGIEPAELYRRIVSTLTVMGAAPQVQALRNAYGLELRDPGKLADRRLAFGLEHDGRLPETIESWENRAIEELLELLLEPPAQAKGIIVVSCRVFNRHIGRFRVELFSDDGVQVLMRTKSFNDWPSMNQLLHTMPAIDGMIVERLLLSVQFLFEDNGADFWVSHGSDSYSLMANAKWRRDISAQKRMIPWALDEQKEARVAEVEFINPVAGQMYALGWHRA